jgi:hypothetical protein
VREEVGVSAVPSGGIFISYRRQETSHLAGRLYDRLANRFGDDQVFMDVDTIELGVDFAQVINEAVSTCAVLLAVIGPHWLTATGEDGSRRLDDPDDIVRLEVATTASATTSTGWSPRSNGSLMPARPAPPAAS